MFRLVKTSETFIDPLMAVCPVGSKVGYTYANLCIIAEGVPNARVYLNSKVLKQALLNNPKLVAEVLGLRVTDLSVKEEPKLKKKKIVEVMDNE